MLVSASTIPCESLYNDLFPSSNFFKVSIPNFLSKPSKLFESSVIVLSP